jgi:alkylmercury lyase
MEHRDFEAVAAYILALFPPLAEAEQRVALALYRLLAEEGAASAASVARAASVPLVDAERMISGWSGVQRERDGTIFGYGGLTSRETAHRMRFGATTRYAWCAWDTLFIPQLLQKTAYVESICPASGERLALVVRPDGIEAAGSARFVSLVAPDPQEAAADIVSHFCCHVHFFASEAAGREWTSSRPGTVLATLAQAWQLGRQRNARRYPVVHA